MTVNGTQLLKRLDPAVRPAYAMPAPTQSGSPIEHQSFDQLLALASRGSISSGRQIEASPDLQPPLDASQLERLAGAADQAEAAGSRRALLIIDGRALVLDVAARAIEAELTATSATKSCSIDTAMLVPRDVGSSVQSLGPGAGVLPPSIAKQLVGPPIVNRQS